MSDLELRAGYEPRGAGGRNLSGLPPVVIILADNLEDVPSVEGDPGLGARDQVVIHGVVLELGPHEDVARRRGRPVGGNNLKWRGGN